MARKIISGKVYDTKKSTRVAKDEYEELYITNNGSWFSYTFINGYLMNLSVEKAYAWLYERSEVEMINHYFPDTIEEA